GADPDELESDLPLQRRGLFCQPDLAHPAFAEPGDDSIVAESLSQADSGGAWSGICADRGKWRAGVAVRQFAGYRDARIHHRRAEGAADGLVVLQQFFHFPTQSVVAALLSEEICSPRRRLV